MPRPEPGHAAKNPPRGGPADEPGRAESDPESHSPGSAGGPPSAEATPAAAPGTPATPGTVTSLVNALGIPGAPIDDAQFQRLYDELRKLASIALSAERDRGALQTTALVHEALIRMGLFEGPQEWRSKAHFFGAAARAMRQILVTEARRRRAEGRVLRILSEASERASRPVDVLELDEALSALEAHDERLARVIILRVFGGLSNEEVAMMLDLSERTILRDWKLARAWILRRLMERGDPTGETARHERP